MQETNAGLGAAPKRHPLEILGFIEASIFGLLWLGLGIAVFVMDTQAKAEYDRLLQHLSRGEVVAVTLYVKSFEDKGDNAEGLAYGSGNWIVRFADANGKIVLRRLVKDPKDFPIGSSVTVLPFRGSYIIPRLGEGNFGVGRWGFLGWGLLPWLCVGSYFALKKFRREFTETIEKENNGKAWGKVNIEILGQSAPTTPATNPESPPEEEP